MRKVTNPLYAMLETLAQIVVPENIYRIQRNGLVTYPNALPEKNKGIVQELYRQFEKTWIDTYANNPYAILTNGRTVTGKNSELTFHINPLERILYVNYNIQTTDNPEEAIGYPITISMTRVVHDRPLIDSVLYLEALGKKENMASFYTGNVLYYEKEYPAVQLVWQSIKEQLKSQLSDAYELGAISDDDWNIWTIGLEKSEMIVTLNDANAMNLPSISVYGNDANLNGKEYATQATIGLIEGAFMFRHENYTPFAKMI